MTEKSQTKISVEEVAMLLARIREINRVPFNEIEWTVKGESAPVDIVSWEEWGDTGLNNTRLYRVL